MALTLRAADFVPLAHVLAFESTLQQISSMDEADIAYTLYAQTATRLAREFRQAEAGVVTLLPEAEQHAALLAIFERAARHAWQFAQMPEIIQALFLRAGELHAQRNRFSPADAARLDIALDELIRFAVGGDGFAPVNLPVLRVAALSLATAGSAHIEDTLWRLNQHELRIADVHAHLRANHRDDPNPADRWGLWPVVTDGGTDLTHEVVVIVDDGEMAGRWAPPPSEEDEDEYYDLLGAAEASETRSPPIDLTNYRGEDLRAGDDWDADEDLRAGDDWDADDNYNDYWRTDDMDASCCYV